MKNKDNNNLKNRPPIVVIMGHVDHGKSSILEAIKDFRITSKESGGITQHIGAYQIEEQGKKITFIDTPGHEAFSQMRSRGAKIADIAILVIDASEGVKPQTKEVVSLIKTLEVPVIVALNKIDKPDANPEKVKRELMKEDLIVESMGGKIPSVEISAKTKKGIPELLEIILLVAELENLEVDESKSAEGIVIESYLDNFRGTTATLLVLNGTLKTGDIIGTPTAYTKIKSLEDFQKKNIKEASPSTPVIVFGFDEVPKVGEIFKSFKNINEAKESVKLIEQGNEEFGELKEDQKVLNIILKADVLGSLEAIEEILKSLPQDKVIVRLLKSEVGNINESDVKLALTGKIKIIGFKVKSDIVAQKVLEREGITVAIFDVIYELLEAVRGLMEKIVVAEEFRVDLGKMKVLAKFLDNKNRQIIGGRATEGEIKKGTKIEVLRNDEIIGAGRMISLQRNKKEADSVSKGDECGILFEGNVKIEAGDILSFFKEERRKSL
ncbi:MAG: translation initiation factor IF-2 [Candidatus Nealsonbacteria bacterium]